MSRGDARTEAVSAGMEPDCARLPVGRAHIPDSEIVFTVKEGPEGTFEATALGHSIHTEADTFEELKGMVQDAMRCHFDEKDRPAVIRFER